MAKAKSKTKKFKPIEVTLVFSKADIQSLLNAIVWGDDRALDVNKLTLQQYRDLKKELQDSADSFVGEIIDGSEEAAANDWMCDFVQKHCPVMDDDDDDN